jgi:hypothetical protein
MSLPDTPPPSPGLHGKDVGDVSQCPFASRMPAVDSAFNPHARPARAHAAIGLETPPLTPVESDIKTVIPMDLDILVPSQAPLDTSFLGVRSCAIFAYFQSLTILFI